MNRQRTYGIEMEMVGAVSHATIAERIRTALREAGSNHNCTSSGWQQNRDATNLTMWVVKTDSSIQTASSHPYQVEVVSPVLKGADGLKALKVVTDVLNTCARVNSSCGLHIHHGIRSNEDLRRLVKAWFRMEEALFQIVPASRRNNRYCYRWGAWYHAPIIRDDQSVREWHNTHIAERYSALNLDSYWIRSTVEFRFHSGSIDYGKIVNWTVATQALVDVALQGGFENSQEPMSLADLSSTIKGIHVPDEPVPVGGTTHRGRYTRANSICDALRKFKTEVPEGAHIGVDEIVAMANQLYTAGGGTNNLKESQWAWRQVASAMLDLGLLKEQRHNKVTITGVGQTVVAGAARQYVSDRDERLALYSNAADWLIARWDHFRNQPAGSNVE
jgi:hypothetical protein